MTFIPPGDWPPNVTPHPHAQQSFVEAQRRQFDKITPEMFAARAREMCEDHPAAPRSEDLVAQILQMPALDGDQLGHKLRLFAIELSKEVEFGQNPDFRLIPFFAAIQSDCIRLLKAIGPAD